MKNFMRKRLYLFVESNACATLCNPSVASFQHGGLESRLTWMSPEASLRNWMPAIHAGMTMIFIFILYVRCREKILSMRQNCVESVALLRQREIANSANSFFLAGTRLADLRRVNEIGDKKTGLIH
jgi:hypothetical protein